MNANLRRQSLAANVRRQSLAANVRRQSPGGLRVFKLRPNIHSSWKNSRGRLN